MEINVTSTLFFVEMIVPFVFNSSLIFFSWTHSIKRYENMEETNPLFFISHLLWISRDRRCLLQIHRMRIISIPLSYTPSLQHPLLHQAIPRKQTGSFTKLPIIQSKLFHSKISNTESRGSCMLSFCASLFLKSFLIHLMCCKFVYKASVSIETTIHSTRKTTIIMVRYLSKD